MGELHMGVSRIEQLIEDIYEFVESCKMQPLSSTKVIVPKDQLYDLLDELRLRTPDEIKRYQKIIANRDAIIGDAEEKAGTMLAQAQEKTNNLVNEHEIMQQAYYQANDVVNQATEEVNNIIAAARQDAEQIRTGALVYTEDILTEVERVLSNAYETSKNKYQGLVDALKGNLDIVINNKKELCQQPEENNYQEESSSEETMEEEADNYYEDEFDIDTNKIFDNIN
jgi:cell division septum initiation protein DivIVA